MHEVLRFDDHIYLILEYVGGGELYVYVLYVFFFLFSLHSLIFHSFIVSSHLSHHSRTGDVISPSTLYLSFLFEG